MYAQSPEARAVVNALSLKEHELESQCFMRCDLVEQGYIFQHHLSLTLVFVMEGLASSARSSMKKEIGVSWFAGLAKDIGNLVFSGLYFGNKEDPQQDEENRTLLVLEACCMKHLY
ncbi:hypothetical protein Pyn_25135 [Prunus yedoensis var. nudiflora]|uniref:Uncharacterized protein n=1 Tax=Prunus yedoensis var. nudiflora TaxID=2094558 RepID=A0A314UXV8_PRUYE|nr:hypothetical protein Pyn_25135 [Prunus yedoensis var. nudiflora]